MSRHRRGEARYPVRGAAWRDALWLGRILLAAGAAVAVWPVTAMAAGAFCYGWWRGSPPRRLLAAAAWTSPMAAAWLIAVVVWPARAGRWHPPGAGPGAAWFRLAAAPYRAFDAMWHLAGRGDLAAGLAGVAPAALPLGLAAGGLAWAYRNFRMRTGAGGLTPAAPAAFDQRQWRHQARSARALIAVRRRLPLLTRNGDVVAGATIRSVRHQAQGAAVIPYQRLRAHQVVIGSTGTGKTTLLLRLWAGFMAAGLRRHAAGTGRRPLLVVLDCKGGASSRKVAGRARQVLRDAGASAVAIWPDEASLSLWALPPDRLVTTLLDLIEHGSGGAAYYADVMEALVALAVYAPCGPPAGSLDFLGRLDADWLAAAYGASGDLDAVATVRSGKNAFKDVRLRFAALWRRLGNGLDGGATFVDADAWYCILEGTAEVAVAEAQARALTDVLAFCALGGEREILLSVDEFSAVSRRLPIWQLYERARSLGLAVQVSAQSWEGLAGSEDERQRVAATAEGGIWLLRTPRPEPVAALAGTLSRVDTTRRYSGAGPWDGDGLSRTRPVPVLDGDLVRRLDIGQAAYIYRGGVTYVQVKRLTGRQAAPGPRPSAAMASGLTRWGEAGWVPADGGSASRHAASAGQPAAGGGPGTRPLPVTGGTARAPWPGPAWPGAAWPGAARSGAAPAAMSMPRMALPDASEILDEAFGERRT